MVLMVFDGQMPKLHPNLWKVHAFVNNMAENMYSKYINLCVRTLLMSVPTPLIYKLLLDIGAFFFLK